MNRVYEGRVTKVSSATVGLKIWPKQELNSERYTASFKAKPEMVGQAVMLLGQIVHFELQANEVIRLEAKNRPPPNGVVFRTDPPNDGGELWLFAVEPGPEISKMEFLRELLKVFGDWDAPISRIDIYGAAGFKRVFPDQEESGA